MTTSVRKRLLWGGVILLLAVLNLWRWAPAFLGKDGRGGDPGRGGGLELDFPATSSASERKPLRDLFASSRKAPSQGTVPARDRAKGTPAITGTPSATAAHPASEASFGYRLMGVVSRGGKELALLGKGEEVLQVGVGEEVEGRYEVRSIGENEVHLTEKGTGNTLRLRIWESQEAGP